MWADVNSRPGAPCCFGGAPGHYGYGGHPGEFGGFGRPAAGFAGMAHLRDSKGFGTLRDSPEKSSSVTSRCARQHDRTRRRSPARPRPPRLHIPAEMRIGWMVGIIRSSWTVCWCQNAENKKQTEKAEEKKEKTAANAGRTAERNRPNATHNYRTRN